MSCSMDCGVRRRTTRAQASGKLALDLRPALEQMAPVDRACPEIRIPYPPAGGGGGVRRGTRSTPRVQASRFELKKSVGLALRRDRLFAASTPPGSGRHGSWRHGGRGPSADRHCARTVARRHGIGRGWCGAGEARAPARCCSPPEPQGVRALSPSAASAGPPPRVIEPLGSSAARSSAAGAEDLHSHR